MTYEQLQLPFLEKTESIPKVSPSLARDFRVNLTVLRERVKAMAMSVTCGGEVARCIREIKPKWFVGENTPGLFARANQRYFKRILADLTEMGYSVSWGIWGAYDVGAPHKRERVFICASDTDRIRNTRQGLDNETASPTNAIRVCCTLPYTTSDELGMYGSTKEIETSTGHGFNNGVRAEKNAIGEWWKAEPDVGRVANGIPARVDKLRCLGNAVVPQQIYPLFEAIAEYEKGEKEHEKEILYG